MVENKMGSRRRWQLLHGLYAMLILAVSSMPASDLPEATGLVSDKTLHFGEYGLLGLLGGWAYLADRRRLWYLMLFGLAFGGLDEFWQSYVPGRVSDFADYLADVAGHLVGISAAAFLVKRFR